PAGALGLEALVLVGGGALALGPRGCRHLRPGQPLVSASGTLLWSPPPQPLRADGSTHARRQLSAGGELQLVCNERPVPFTGEVLLVGRDPRCHLRLRDREVSGFHCALR